MKETKYLQLNDIAAYKTAFNLANYVWKTASLWRILEQRTVGEQFIRAVDSISANIAEGLGRHHKKDKIKFYYYARASVQESLDWNLKAKVRGLLTEKQYQTILQELQKLPFLINSLVRWTRVKLRD
ncbi:MAG: four helix bundle protein [Patescibacteria group bacterium]|jgi:four helix bundle protein